MTFEALASSSHGNAYVIADEQTTIVIECGIAHRTLLKRAGLRPSAIAGLLISHEHKDHCKSVCDFLADGVPVYMSGGTAAALDLDEVHVVEAGQQIEIGTFGVLPFTTYHDAAEPLGYLIQSRIDGDVLAFAIDTVNLGWRFPGVNILAIEANFLDERLERATKMPDKVKARIRGTHMEIDVLCRYLDTLDLSRCRRVYLMHLSDSCSHELDFINRVRRHVPPETDVVACPR